MRILCCGSRYWDSEERMRPVIESFPKGSVIIHGAAKGADTMAGRIAKELGHEVIVFPAKWNVYGRAAGPIRNKQMITEGKPDVVYAFHDNIAKSKGTKDMVGQAKDQGITVLVIP